MATHGTTLLKAAYPAQKRYQRRSQGPRPLRPAAVRDLSHHFPAIVQKRGKPTDFHSQNLKFFISHSNNHPQFMEYQELLETLEGFDTPSPHEELKSYTTIADLDILNTNGSIYRISRKLKYELSISYMVSCFGAAALGFSYGVGNIVWAIVLSIALVSTALYYLSGIKFSNSV